MLCWEHALGERWLTHAQRTPVGQEVLLTWALGQLLCWAAVPEAAVGLRGCVGMGQVLAHRALLMLRSQKLSGDQWSWEVLGVKHRHQW